MYVWVACALKSVYCFYCCLKEPHAKWSYKNQDPTEMGLLS